jgi:hypothetical protein
MSNGRLKDTYECCECGCDIPCTLVVAEGDGYPTSCPYDEGTEPEAEWTPIGVRMEPLQVENRRLKAQLADAITDLKVLIALMDMSEVTPETLEVVKKWGKK